MRITKRTLVPNICDFLGPNAQASFSFSLFHYRRNFGEFCCFCRWVERTVFVWLCLFMFVCLIWVHATKFNCCFNMLKSFKDSTKMSFKDSTKLATRKCLYTSNLLLVSLAFCSLHWSKELKPVDRWRKGVKQLKCYPDNNRHLYLFDYFVVFFYIVLRIFSGEAGPNRVQEIKTDSLGNLPVLYRDDGMNLYGPPVGQFAADRKVEYTIVLNRLCTDNPNVAFRYIVEWFWWAAAKKNSYHFIIIRLYRAATQAEAEDKFNALMGRLPTFVSIAKEVRSLIIDLSPFFHFSNSNTLHIDI